MCTHDYSCILLYKDAYFLIYSSYLRWTHANIFCTKELMIYYHILPHDFMNETIEMYSHLVVMCQTATKRICLSKFSLTMTTVNVKNMEGRSFLVRIFGLSNVGYHRNMTAQHILHERGATGFTDAADEDFLRSWKHNNYLFLVLL